MRSSRVVEAPNILLQAPRRTHPTTSSVVLHIAANIAPLRVRTLGAFTVWKGETPIPAQCWTRPTILALFKCLLSTHRQRLEREQAIELLWPAVPYEKGATILRTAIHRLRGILDGSMPADRSLAHSYLQTQGTVLMLDPLPGGERPSEWLDADAFALGATAAIQGSSVTACQDALALYGGEYLPDDLYYDWATGRREMLRQLHRDLLLHLSRLCIEADHSELATAHLRAVLADDACQEEAARLLMRLLVQGGGRVEALRVYDTLARALRDELEVRPTPETEVLRAEILAQARVESTASANTATNTALSGQSDSQVPATVVPPSSSLLAGTLQTTHSLSPLGERHDWRTGAVERESERAALRSMLMSRTTDRRVLTLVGPGGCGKTWLVRALATDLAETYQDGISLVELAWLAAPPPHDEHTRSVDVVRAIAAVLDLGEEPEGDPLTAVITYLEPRHLLLVLDHCTHLVGTCALLVAALLDACPHLQILVTSCQPLDVHGEMVWPVPPLRTLPHVAQDGAHEQALTLAANEALRLFLGYAHARGTTFSSAQIRLREASQVSGMLSALPLAIELVASQPALPLDQLAGHLNDWQKQPLAAPSSALPAADLMHMVLDWCYRLLNAHERAVLRRLAVFVADWTLDAAEAVCTETMGAASAVRAALARLQAYRLVQPAAGSGSARFTLPACVREFAYELLEQQGETSAAQRAHAGYMLALATATTTLPPGPERLGHLAHLQAEYHNLQTALQWIYDHKEVELGLRLFNALTSFWHASQRKRESLGWFERLTTMLEPSARNRERHLTVPTALWSDAFHSGAGLALPLGEYHLAREFAQNALAIARIQGDISGVARALLLLGRIEVEQSDFQCAAELLGGARGLAETFGKLDVAAQARITCGWLALGRSDHRAAVLAEDGLRLLRQLNDTTGAAEALLLLGTAMYAQGENIRAQTLCRESLELARTLGDHGLAAQALSTCGRVACALGDYSAAARVCSDGLSLAQRLGNRWLIAHALGALACLAHAQGNHSNGHVLQRERLLLYSDLGDRRGVAECLEELAGIACARGQAGLTAHLLGAADALRRVIDAPLAPTAQTRKMSYLMQARHALGDAQFAATWVVSQSLPLQQVIFDVVQSA